MTLEEGGQCRSAFRGFFEAWMPRISGPWMALQRPSESSATLTIFRALYPRRMIKPVAQASVSVANTTAPDLIVQVTLPLSSQPWKGVFLP